MKTNPDKTVINMKSAATSVPGQGVGSAYTELMSLLRETASGNFAIYENARVKAGITHYHTINLPYFLSIPSAKLHGVAVGSVHFLP